MNKQPWKKRDSETDKAYAAFCVYRDMGPDRTLDKTRKELGKKSLTWIGKWSSENDWVKRCEAYDAHRDEIRLEAREQALRDAQHKLTTEALTVLEKALEGIQSGEISTPQQRAIADWLDRAGLKPVEKTENTHKLEDTTADQITALLGIGKTEDT